jgi:hypothetical protein
MKDNNAHPARSVDFLSRLHDGELTAAERAHFESHRAHCADCRKAALEFEAALTLFRASRTSPASPDLSARILRKLQAASPRRSPFGVVFGINLKWAAAFAVAILATIVGSVAVIQRESLRKAAPRPAPIPVLLQSEQRPAKTQDALNFDSAPPRAAANKAPSRKEPAPTAAPAPERYAPEPASPAAGLLEGKVSAPSRRPAEAQAPRAPRTKEETASPLLRAAESPGGEAGAAAATASAEPGSPARPVLVALDGQGTAPEIISPGAAEILADLRGRRYFLLVEASGRVIEARSDVGKRAKMQTVPQAVRDLRFQATDRPRRLLLRID